MGGPVSGAAPELKSFMLRAGAGAGKTRTLVATLLQAAAEWEIKTGEFPSVVITTFTRKATQELKERLLRAAAAEAQTARMKGDEQTAERFDRIFLWLGQRSKVQISTIHGVLSLFLHRSLPLIGFPSEFSIASEEELVRLRKKLLRQMLLEEKEKNPENSSFDLLEEYSFNELLSLLMAWHERRSFHPELRPIRGEELRRMAFEQVKDLFAEASGLAEGIRASSKLKSWLSWADLLAGIQPLQDESQLSSAIEGLISRFEQFSLRKPSLGKVDKPQVDFAIGERVLAWIEKIRQDVLKDKSRHFYDSASWAAHDRLASLFESLARPFSDQLRLVQAETGLLSMADLENLSLEILREFPEAGAAFSKEWDYWMVDEYQDTSPLQVALLKSLVLQSPSFVVGDPQQSIYSFRGARSEVFHELFDQMKEAGHQTELRYRNHRSRGPLLEFFNEFYRPFPQFEPMEVGSDQEPRLEEPVALIWPLPPVAESQAEEAEELESAEASDQCVEAVLQRIQELRRDGVAPEKICVLARKGVQLRQILEAARAYQIPMQLHSTQGFDQRREVRDAKSFLKFLIQPWDRLSLLILLRSPWFRCSDDEITEICQGPKSPWSEILDRAQKKSPPHPFARLRIWRERASQVGLSATLREFYRQEGILDLTEALDPSGRREANLWKLLLQLEKAQKEPGFQILSFLEQGQMRLSTDEADEADAIPAIEPRRVNLMTVHASKGLEFDHVILTHLHCRPKTENSGLFEIEESSGLWCLQSRDPEGQRRSTALAQRIVEEKRRRSTEESWRVLYVALTRAKTSVSLIWEKNQKGEVSSSSWASRVPFASLSPGVHRLDSFCLEIREGRPTPLPLEQDRVPAPRTRELWSPPQRVTRTRESVTSLLERLNLASDKANPESKQKDLVAMTSALEIAQRGTEAHRLFEALKYQPFEQVQSQVAEKNMKLALDWIQTLQSPPLLQLIEAGEPEWGFCVSTEKLTLQGQIDLWADLGSKIWIVDYKTGSSRYAEKALDQLLIYAWALRRMGLFSTGQELGLSAIYPLEQKIKTRDFSASEGPGSEWKRLGLE